MKSDVPCDELVDFEDIGGVYFQDPDDREKPNYDSTDELLNEMNEKLMKLKAVYSISVTKIRITMDELGWNTHKFYETVFDGEHIDKFLFTVFFVGETLQKECFSENCLHCTDKPILALLCRHKFCDKCLAQFISSQVKSTSARKFVTCPCCDYILEDDFVIQQLSIEDKHVYKKLILGKYAMKKSVMFCPSQGCHLILNSKRGNIFCQCGFSFCIKCGSDEHEPVLCRMMEAWKNLQIELSEKHISEEIYAMLCTNGNRVDEMSSIIESAPGSKLYIDYSEKYIFYQRCLKSLREFVKVNSELFNNSIYITPRFLENIESCYSAIMTGFMFACFKMKDTKLFMINLADLVKITERLNEILENAIFGAGETKEMLYKEISEKCL